MTSWLSNNTSQWAALVPCKPETPQNYFTITFSPTIHLRQLWPDWLGQICLIHSFVLECLIMCAVYTKRGPPQVYILPQERIKTSSFWQTWILGRVIITNCAGIHHCHKMIPVLPSPSWCQTLPSPPCTQPCQAKRWTRGNDCDLTWQTHTRMKGKQVLA